MSWASRVDTHIEGDFGKSYLSECEKHGARHWDDEACPVCLERYEEARKIKAKRKKLRDLKAATKKAYISDKTIDAVNQAWYFSKPINGGRVY
jgi:hypothetical protein